MHRFIIIVLFVGGWIIETQLRVSYTLGYLFQHLISEFPQGIAHVRHLLLYNLLQKRR